MRFGSILLLAVGLAMDAAAVSAARGIAASKILPRHVLMVAGFFGGFQALMPLIGWLLGARVGHLVEAWDHWIAFGLLAGIGGKMIFDALRSNGDEKPPGENVFALKSMLVLAIATSIDALAVGITLPMLGAPLVLTLATIGITTGLLSCAGLFAGRRFGASMGSRLDIIGGIVLVGLGIKILVEHLRAA